MAHPEYEHCVNLAELSKSRWLIGILLGALLVPAISVAVFSIPGGNLFSGIAETVCIIPGLAWVFYLAWRRRQGKGFRLVSFCLIVIVSNALAIFVEWQVGDRFPPDIFSHVLWTRIKFELMYLLGVLIWLMIGARFFRFHLMRIHEMEIQFVRISIPFLMLMQAMLAIWIWISLVFLKQETKVFAGTDVACHATLVDVLPQTFYRTYRNFDFSSS